MEGAAGEAGRPERLVGFHCLHATQGPSPVWVVLGSRANLCSLGARTLWGERIFPRDSSPEVSASVRQQEQGWALTPSPAQGSPDGAAIERPMSVRRSVPGAFLLHRAPGPGGRGGPSGSGWDWSSGIGRPRARSGRAAGVGWLGVKQARLEPGAQRGGAGTPQSAAISPVFLFLLLQVSSASGAL